MTEKQVVTAGMLARGHSARSIARTLHISPRTIRMWKDNADFQAEYERVLARGGAPDPHGTLLDCLSARRDDGIDWASRLRAALALLEMDGDDTDDRAPVASEW